MHPFPAESPSRSLLSRRTALPAVCLCLVAGLHAYRVAVCGQTPWKGGGFGMFSTVDAEASRFIRAWAVTDDGPIPLLVPSALQNRAAELCAAPTQAATDDFARQLSRNLWRLPSASDEAAAIAVANRPRGTAVSAAMLHASARSSPQPRPGELQTAEAFAPSDAAVGATPSALQVHSIRVDVLRCEFRSRDSSLQAHQLFSATEPVRPAPRVEGAP